MLTERQTQDISLRMIINFILIASAAHSITSARRRRREEEEEHDFFYFYRRRARILLNFDVIGGFGEREKWAGAQGTVGRREKEVRQK